MPDVRSAAAAYGLGIEVADLGAWAGATLIAEYDPPARMIRVNARAVAAYRQARDAPAASSAVTTFVDLAIAHELYHHREAIGESARLGSRAQREAAADAYARANVAVDGELDAYLSNKNKSRR